MTGQMLEKARIKDLTYVLDDVVGKGVTLDRKILSLLALGNKLPDWLKSKGVYLKSLDGITYDELRHILGKMEKSLLRVQPFCPYPHDCKERFNCSKNRRCNYDVCLNGRVFKQS